MVKGLIIICNEEFVVENIPFDNFSADSSFFISRLFSELVVPDENLKVNNFLDILKKDGAAFNWTINFNFPFKTMPLIFSATNFENKYLIIGVETNEDIPFLYEELMRINIEQTNYIRSIVKEKFIVPAITIQPGETYDELSKLNNELVNLQRELAKKNIELAKLNRLKNQFIGIAAHDLRNPLSAILSQSDYLSEELRNKISSEDLDFINSIKKSSYYMLSLVEDLLDVSKIEAGKLDLEMRKTDFIAFLEEIIKSNNILSRKKDILITLRTEIKALSVAIDIQKITQVINNLLTNAVKFSHPGSEIILTTAIQDDHLIISVIDKGVGIKENYLKEIFAPFGKAKSRGTANEKSTGLGLSICKKIIEGHKGHIWVDSEVEKGSTFSFSLPLNEDV